VASALHGIDVKDGHDTISGNVVTANAHSGIEVYGSSTFGIRLSANQIFNNGDLGIDLVGGTETALKVTAQDVDDPDGGPNGLQNYPALTSATRSIATGLTTVIGTLNSTPSTQFTIELFMCIADASGHGEGQVLVASQNVTTNSGGDVGFNFVTNQLAPGAVLTTTATTTTAGATSEFGANVSVTVVP
jgi:hypothetical protein